MKAAARLILVSILGAAISACSTMGGLSPDARTAAAFDPLADDIAAMVIAVDLPDSLSPGLQGPRLLYGTGPLQMDLTYDFGDAEAVMAALPEPPEGRRYVVYALAGPDRARVRTAQQAGASAIEVIPRFCTTPDSRADRDALGVLGILPGGRVVTLMPRETIAALAARTGETMPACG